jgi:hypothetical protein
MSLNLQIIYLKINVPEVVNTSYHIEGSVILLQKYELLAALDFLIYLMPLYKSQMLNENW